MTGAAGGDGAASAAQVATARAGAVVAAALFGSLAATGGHGDASRAGTWAAAAITALLGVGTVPVARSLAGRALPPVALVAAVASAAAAAIHLAVAGEHFEDWWATGLFFVVAGAAQIAWAALVAVAPAPLLSLAGVAGNAAIVVLWAVTRTVGLPFGPRAGAGEPVGSADVTATLLELVVVGASLLLLAGREGRAWSSRLPAALVVALALVVTTLALGADTGHG